MFLLSRGGFLSRLSLRFSSNRRLFCKRSRGCWLASACGARVFLSLTKSLRRPLNSSNSRNSHSSAPLSRSIFCDGCNPIFCRHSTLDEITHAVLPVNLCLKVSPICAYKLNKSSCTSRSPYGGLVTMRHGLDCASQSAMLRLSRVMYLLNPAAFTLASAILSARAERSQPMILCVNSRSSLSALYML